MYTIFESLINTINNSKFLSSVMVSTIIVLALAFLIYIIKLLGNIRMFIQNKSDSYVISNRKNTNLDNANLSMPERIDLTVSILDIITSLINTEITSIFKENFALNNLYNISNLDTDVAKISDKVFKGIRPMIFKDPNLILTEEYLMSYITKKTINTMIEVATTYNDNLRKSNQSVGD